MSTDPYEIIGAATGIIGAIMLAINCRYSAWAWPLWIVSGVAWIAYANTTSAYGLMTQQAVFTTINIVGTWRWLIQPSTNKKSGDTVAQTVIQSIERNH